jgi:putative oxidoreductase
MTHPIAGALEKVRSADRALALLAPLADLLARLYIARVFLLSGWSKISDWDTTLYLFTDEYHVPLLPPNLAAILGTGGELLFPVMLVLGLFTRLSALGLFCLNIVALASYWHVLKDVPVALADHLVWGLMLGLLMTWQGGRWEILDTGRR